MFVAILFSALIFNFKYLIFRPIKIKVEMINKLTGKKEADIVDRNRRIEEDTATVSVKVLVKNSQSIWNSILYKILKNKEIKLKLYTVGVIEGEESFIYQPIQIVSNINNEFMKVIVGLDDIILENLRVNQNYAFEFEYCIKTNRDNYPALSQEFFIRPEIFVNINWINLFVKIEEQEKSFYKINYIKV